MFKVLMFQCDKDNCKTQILILGDFCNILVGFCNIPAYFFFFYFTHILIEEQKVSDTNLLYQSAQHVT